MRTHSRLLSLTIAALAGLVVMIVANQVGRGGDLLAPTEYLAMKGLLYGALAGLLGFGITQILLASRRARSWVLLSTGIVLALFALLVTSWNLMWGIPPV